MASGLQLLDIELCFSDAINTYPHVRIINLAI